MDVMKQVLMQMFRALTHATRLPCCLVLANSTSGDCSHRLSSEL